MTVVIGVNYFTEIVMMADTRVSWSVGKGPSRKITKVQDCLQKLYVLDSPQTPDKVAVLGFCCNALPGVSEVIRYLAKDKLEHYNRRLVMATLKDEVHRWIEEAAVARLTPETRDGLRFMLCGIEPSRHMTGKRGNKTVTFTIGSVPTCEAHIYVYTVNKASGAVFVTKCPRFAVIGSGKGLERQIAKQALETQRFGLRYPHLHPARAHVLSDNIAFLFRDDESVQDVGGPFQYVRITPNPKDRKTGYIWWPPDTPSKNIEVQGENDKIKIYNPGLQQEYVLYPIWEYPPPRS